MLGQKVKLFGFVALAGLLAVVPVTKRSPVGAYSDSREPLDALGYRIALELNPDPSTFRASTAITVQITRDGTRRLRFDFVGHVVDSVTVDGAQASYEREDGALEVELERSAADGDTLVVAVFYRGAPQDGLSFQRNIYGRPAVFADNWPDRARYWFPSVDHPSDKAMVEFRVRAPEAWEVVSVGRLIEEPQPVDGTKLWVWATDRPIPVYTMVVGAAEMVVRTLGSTGCDVEASPCIRVTQWTFAEDADVAERLLRRAPEIVAFYDSLIGPFPYEKLALVQSSTRFGGMENASAIFLPQRFARMRYAEGLLAHEIAHQWFGDAVTEREWSHIWLSEGFATYFASVFLEFRDGDSVAAVQRAQGESALYAGRAADRPVIDREPENLMRLLSPNAYQKGAWVLHMLRQTVGDEVFFAGIRRYYEEYLHGTALSDDLQRIMEEVSGEDLNWFFDQWLERPGYPRLEVSYSWDASENSLELRVQQVQPWKEFRFPLELEAEGGGYELRKTFWVEKNRTDLEWTLPGEPVQVRADPDNAILGPVEIVR